MVGFYIGNSCNEFEPERFDRQGHAQVLAPSMVVGVHSFARTEPNRPAQPRFANQGLSQELAPRKTADYMREGAIFLPNLKVYNDTR